MRYKIPLIGDKALTLVLNQNKLFIKTVMANFSVFSNWL